MKYKVKIKIFIFGWRQGRDGGGSVTYVVTTWNNYSIYILLCNLVINIKKDIPHTCTPYLFDNRIPLYPRYREFLVRQYCAIIIKLSKIVLSSLLTSIRD